MLEGVFNKEHVEFVRLETPQGRSWELGVAGSNHDTEQLEFFFDANTDEPQRVGDLKIGISGAAAVKRLWRQAGIVLLTNFSKALLASFAISILFERSISRHLRKVAQHVSETDWQQDTGAIQLDRRSRPKDDIGRIVHAIHSAKQRTQAHFSLLSEEIELRKKAQNSLKLRTAELENANREQAEFTYAISHDMKSPANTLKLLIGDLRIIGEETFDEECIEILEDMELTASRMTNLIDDVLQYAFTVEAEVCPEEVDLDDVFEDICADLKGDIRSRSAKVTRNALPVIQGSRMQIRLLLQNLLANALKFHSPDRDPIIRVEATSTNDKVILQVTDNGIGIPEEHFERIFGMFKRLHSQGDYEGTGLGLSLCKRIVLNHGGKIEVSSTLDKGTCFKMEFNSHA